MHAIRFLLLTLTCKNKLFSLNRDGVFPLDLVLEGAVAILTENYRGPFHSLLDKSSDYLSKDVSKILEDTLGAYPHFKVLHILIFACREAGCRHLGNPF